MNVEAFFAAPLIIQIHAISAVGALGLGVVQFTAPKGTIPHRTLGYVWVALMAMTAGTAFFIRSHPEGHFSWIHIFIPITLLGIVDISIRARRGLTAKHRAAAITLFIGALVIPGAFTFLPGRLMHEVFVG